MRRSVSADIRDGNRWRVTYGESDGYMQNPVVTTVLGAAAFVLGATVGSFLNVCIFRMPRGESIVFPGSHCLSCGTPVRWYDNIPIVSYFILQGRCRRCGTHFSAQYPLIEFMTAALFLCVYLKFSVTLATPVYWALIGALVVVTWIDLYYYIIPNRITVTGVVAGLLLSVLAYVLPSSGLLVRSPVNALVGVLLGAGILYLADMFAVVFLNKAGMGGGDLKLLAMLGAFLGWKMILPILFVASIIGSAVGIPVLMLRRKKQGPSSHYIPFGPYLAAAGVLMLFFGNHLLEWWAALSSTEPGY